MAVPCESAAPTVVGGEQALRTQISGRYSLDNPGVFMMKQQLVEAGIDVAFPVGNAIIEHSCGFAITVPHESRTPFHETELQFLREIRDNPFQITYNIYGAEDGYVGESTGLETMYALLCNKPTVLLRRPGRYSPTIHPPVMELVERYKDAMLVEPIDQMERQQLGERLAELACAEVNYGLSKDEAEVVMDSVFALTKKYHRDWEDYMRLRRMDIIR